jgi:hypothetical protein
MLIAGVIASLLMATLGIFLMNKNK